MKRRLGLISAMVSGVMFSIGRIMGDFSITSALEVFAFIILASMAGATYDIIKARKKRK